MTLSYGIPDPPEYTCCVCGNTLDPGNGYILKVGDSAKFGYCRMDCVDEHQAALDALWESIVPDAWWRRAWSFLKGAFGG